MSGLRDEDVALAMAFVDGELEGPARARFELQLADEPELAAEVERLFGTDELVRRNSRSSAADRLRRESPGPAAIPARPRFRLLPALLLAAATIAGILGLRVMLGPEPSTSRGLQVAIAPGFESAREAIGHEPRLAELRPAGLDDVRGPGETTNVDARAFVAAAEQADRDLFDRLGRPQPEPGSAAFFVLPVRSPEPRSVLVLGFPRQGAPLRYWPAADDARRSADQGRVQTGDHVLPGARFRLVEDARGDRVAYDRGFLVPIGAVSVDVVVASRAAPLDDATLQTAGGLLAPGSDAAGASERLRALGFDVEVLSVREP